MPSTNLLTATATQIGLQDGTISLAQILKDHHRRYKQRDGDVHAWVVTRHLPLLAEAEAAMEDDRKQGDHTLLRGVTLGVKDIMSESFGLLLLIC
jgi:Asp-tRNA(Asn)/Glu-tRNA(Gln) amidotransferase A subunit family amidase